MPLVDIGANLTHPSFHDDLDAVVARARAAGVGTIVVTGTTALESRLAAEIADRLDLYCTAGVHPHHARDFDQQTIAELRKLALHPRCVAQLEMALELGKPLFLHSRDAHPRFAQIVRTHGVKQAVAHCFTGEAEELHAYLDLGLYVGITGWISDERRGTHVLRLVQDIP